MPCNSDITNKECDIVLNLFKRGLVNNMRNYGEVRLSMPYLIQYIFPKYSSWGCHSLDTRFDIMEFSPKSQSNIQNKIGEMNISLSMRMQMFPRVRTDRITVRGDQAPNYHFLFDILIDKFIEHNFQQRTSSKHRFELLNYHQKWILEEYSNQHGISEAYRKLSVMRLVVRRTDILLLTVKDFRQSIDFVINGIKSKTVFVSRRESDMLFGIKEELVKKIEFVLAQFITLLDGGSRAVLEILVELLEYMQTKNNVEEDSMTKEQFAQYLTSLVSRAIEQDYLNLRKEQIAMCEDDQEQISAPSLIKLTQLMTTRIEYVMYYSSAIPEYVNFQANAIRSYYDHIAKDCEAVLKLSGFTGYQMLYFCRKLEEYHDEISDCLGYDVTRRRDFRTIDIPTISLGYAAKYVQELKSRLVAHIQRAVELETWKPVGDNCLHSQSLVDFFTSANQILSYMIDVEFMTEDLLNMFCEAVGDCVVEYAKILQLLCLREILKQSDGKQGTTRKSLLNLSHLLSYGNSTNKEETKEIDITPEFIIKVNNIDASFHQYRHVVKSVTDIKLRSSDDEDDDDDDDDDDGDDDMDDNDDDEEIPSEDPSDNNDNRPTPHQVNMDDDRAQKLKNEAILAKFNRTMEELDAIGNELISLVALQFEPCIQVTLMRIMQQVKKDSKQIAEMDEQEIVDVHGREALKSFKDSFLDTVLTPNLATLSENIYHTAFKKILRALYSIFLKQCEDILMPDISLGYESQALAPGQIPVLKHLVDHVSKYFAGGGEGLDPDDMKRQRRFIRSIFRMSEMSTDKLIELHERLTRGDKSCPVKGYHALSILSTRKKKDKIAARFLKENQDKSLQLLLVHEFGINGDTEHESNFATTLLGSYWAMNEKLTRGKCFLLPNFILWKPYYGKSRRSGPSFAKSLTAIDSHSSKIKLCISDIREVKPLNPIVGKGIKFHLKDKSSVRIYLESRKVRDQLLNQIMHESKKFDVPIVVLDASSGTSSRQKNRNITTTNLDTSAINPALVIPEDIEKTLRSRFGITATLVERFSCKCSVGNEDEHGTLYLFDNCFCFDAFGNYSIDASDLIASWHMIENIEYYGQDMEVVMTFRNGKVVLFYRFLSEMSLVTRCIDQLYTQFKNNNVNLMALKTSDPKTYFTARFGIKGDVLHQFIACSMPGTTFFSVSGILYVGHEFVCFEKDNSSGQSDFIMFPRKAIQSTSAKSWNLRSNSCLGVRVKLPDRDEEQAVYKFIVPNQAKEVEGWLTKTR